VIILGKKDLIEQNRLTLQLVWAWPASLLEKGSPGHNVHPSQNND